MKMFMQTEFKGIVLNRKLIFFCHAVYSERGLKISSFNKDTNQFLCANL